MLRHGIRLSLSGFFVLFFVSVFSCESLQKLAGEYRPEVQFEKLEFVGLDEESLHLKGILAVKNRLPVEIPAGKLDVRVQINGIDFSSYQIPFRTLPADSSTPVELEFSISYLKMKEIYESVENLKLIPVSFAGSMAVDLSKVSAKLKGNDAVRISFSKEILFPAIFPSFRVENFAVSMEGGGELSILSGLLSRRGLSGNIEINYDLVIANRAKGSFEADGLSYSLKLNNIQILNARSVALENRGNLARISVRTLVPLSQLTEQNVKLLARKKMKYRVEGNVRLSFPDYEGIPPVHYNLEKSGNL